MLLKIWDYTHEVYTQNEYEISSLIFTVKRKKAIKYLEIITDMKAQHNINAVLG